MIPLAPALFLAAVQALAADERSRRSWPAVRPDDRHAWQSKPDDASAACELIHRAGWSSHYDPRAGRSAWPLPDARQPDELRAFAHAAGILSDVAMAGDLYYCERSRVGIARVGVVTRVVDRAPQVATSLQRCEIIYGREEGARTLGISRACWWFSSTGGDRFIRWVDLDSLRPAVTVDELLRK